MTTNATLESVLPILGEEYKAWKEHESKKDEAKASFFELADKEIEHRDGLAIKLVDYQAASQEIAEKRALLHNPGWTIDEARHNVATGLFEVILREDPSLKAFTYEHEGIKYARSVRRGSVMVDDEWLKEEAPELHQEVTFTLPWGAAIMRPLETLTKKQISGLQPYIYSNKPQVALAAPRPVKKEEDV